MFFLGGFFHLKISLSHFPHEFGQNQTKISWTNMKENYFFTGTHLQYWKEFRSNKHKKIFEIHINKKLRMFRNASCSIYISISTNSSSFNITATIKILANHKHCLKNLTKLSLFASYTIFHAYTQHTWINPPFLTTSNCAAD